MATFFAYLAERRPVARALPERWVIGGVLSNEFP
jgi:hypothetical protein